MTDFTQVLNPSPDVTYPHCDWRVLHSPGSCVYCDCHPDWQRARTEGRVLFTDDPRNEAIVERELEFGLAVGVGPDDQDGWLSCPAWRARGANCQVWGGNVPRPRP